MRNLEVRIAKLEAVTGGTRRKVVIWEDGTGSAKREIARLLATGGSNDVDFVIVSWLRDQQPAGEEGSGLRKAKGKSGAQHLLDARE